LVLLVLLVCSGHSYPFNGYQSSFRSNNQWKPIGFRENIGPKPRNTLRTGQTYNNYERRKFSELDPPNKIYLGQNNHYFEESYNSPATVGDFDSIGRKYSKPQISYETISPLKTVSDRKKYYSSGEVYVPPGREYTSSQSQLIFATRPTRQLFGGLKSDSSFRSDMSQTQTSPLGLMNSLTESQTNDLLPLIKALVFKITSDGDNRSHQSHQSLKHRAH